MPIDQRFIVQSKGKDFVLYAGLLDEAHNQGLCAITTDLLQVPNDSNGQTAICRSTVVTSKGMFTGIGDANPGNVTRLVAAHIIRMAETRAKARALRDAVNVGMVALEELGDDAEHPQQPAQRPQQRQQAAPQKQPDNTSPGTPAERLVREAAPLGWTVDQIEKSAQAWFGTAVDKATDAQVDSALAMLRKRGAERAVQT